ncbi:UDP-glucuronosyltransferase 1A1-like isoform X3 [Protopterus annectens]|uniref:UDP-glucuronosyltransferase 1A1-like isoform X3 n=1 Tax=Protopterus annectens TaxID=7888 RepID=UPI001CFAFD4D|nr:UDP-glucuronosyltransferase 1A1-like isoform X3 [Protopterus annectens]
MSVTPFPLSSSLMCLQFLVCLLIFFSAEGKKLLVVPADGSHWLSMQILVEEMAQRGHDVVVLVPEANMLIEASTDCKLQHFPVPYSKEDFQGVIDGIRENFLNKTSALQGSLGIILQLQRLTALFFNACESLMSNEEILKLLKSENFDAILADAFTPCGSILAHYISVPLIHFLKAIPCGLEHQALQCPSPPSYIPRMLLEFSDHMMFFQRMANFLFAFTEPMVCKVIYSSFEDLAKKVLQKHISLQEMMSYAAIWLVKYDFISEYPRPLMPNMVLIGGINCKQNKHLSPVLWRYTGPVPPNLAENTKVLKWLPQNDLLAHPKTRAFITHGGSHGIYEAICNGVPMIMVPLFGDQPGNVQRMERRGAGITLSFHDITSQKLLDALEAVINTTRYKDRMMELSAVHKDRPVEPLDLAVHWIEFVMRHKGANHLRPAAHDLNWIQYHSLDVIAFLAAIILIVVYIEFKCCLFCCKKLFCKRFQQKSKSE